jgi:cytochrome c556
VAAAAIVFADIPHCSLQAIQVLHARSGRLGVITEFDKAGLEIGHVIPNFWAGVEIDFNASPKVWDNMADFKARFVKFGDDAKAAASSVKDLDSLKAAMGNIGKNDCGSCHETYRVKKG